MNPEGPTSERNLETVKATLDNARADYRDELDRTTALDSKLTNLAGFAGVSLSISGSVGSSVVLAGHLSLGFTIAVGACLATAVVFLLATVIACFIWLAPQNYPGLAERGSRGRLDEDRLSQDPSEALVNLAATYYLELLPKYRAINLEKANDLRRAYVLVSVGFSAIALALVVAVVGAVV